MQRVDHLLAWVIHASVLTGGISDTVLTRVVFPTPNPPATTIFAEVVVRAPVAAGGAGLELAKSTEHPFEQVEIWAAMCMVQLVNPDQPFHRHICDQDTRHAQGHPEHGGYLRH